MIHLLVNRIIRGLRSILVLAHFATAIHAAPVEERVASREPPQTSYRVQGGDTLYSIGRRFGADAKTLAELNGMSPDVDFSKPFEGLGPNFVNQINQTIT